MALKKSELYSSLWQSCDELRGGMDASQYKDYVLVLLFIKYVSDKYAGVPFAPITIPPGASFKDMVALKGKSDIGDQINKKIIGPLANANKLSDMPDFNDATKLGSGKALIVARYFAKEQAAIDTLAAELESAAARLVELEEEHGGEEGIFSALDKLNRANVIARLREISGLFATDGDESREEAAVLDAWLELSNQEAELKKKLKDAEATLDAKAYAHYPKLSAAEIQTLVVDDKWLGALDVAIHGEMDRISQALTRRVKELAERYETPLPQMVSRVAELEANVNRHLERMGFTWN
jgi:hypothetical protein